MKGYAFKINRGILIEGLIADLIGIRCKSLKKRNGRNITKMKKWRVNRKCCRENGFLPVPIVR